jgi:hypothetical protein
MAVSDGAAMLERGLHDDLTGLLNTTPQLFRRGAGSVIRSPSRSHLDYVQ